MVDMPMSVGDDGWVSLPFGKPNADKHGAVGEYHKEEDAAIIVQAMARVLQARFVRNMKQMRKEEEEEAATVIATKVRGKKAKGKAKKKKQEKAENDAATTVQAGVRSNCKERGLLGR